MSASAMKKIRPQPVFGWEKLDDLLADGAEELVCRHWKEIALDQDAVPLDLDWPAMRRDEAAGTLKVFSARLDGEILGYITFKMYHPDRYRSTLYCNADVFYFTPHERGKGHGMAMFRAAKDALPKPCKVQIRRKLGLNDEAVDHILRSLGLTPIEMCYSGFFA